MACAVVVVVHVHEVGSDGVVAPSSVGDGLMCLVGRIIDIEAVGGISLAVLVALSEDELAVLAVQEQVGEILLCLRDRGGRSAIEGELARIHDLLAGPDALVVVGVSVSGFHVGEFLLHGLVVAWHGLLVPVFADGSGIQGHAGEESQRRPLGSAVLAVVPVRREKLCSLLKL